MVLTLSLLTSYLKGDSLGSLEASAVAGHLAMTSL